MGVGVNWLPLEVGSSQLYTILALHGETLSEYRDGIFIPAGASPFNARKTDTCSIIMLTGDITDIPDNTIVLGTVNVTQTSSTKINLKIVDGPQSFLSEIGSIDTTNLSLGVSRIQQISNNISNRLAQLVQPSTSSTPSYAPGTIIAYSDYYRDW